MRPGGRGRLPAPGAHRPERAQLGHSAPRTMASLRWRVPASRRFRRLTASGCAPPQPEPAKVLTGKTMQPDCEAQPRSRKRAAGLALRRRVSSVSRPSVRSSARQAMIRSVASRRRIPWGRFPDFSGTINERRLPVARPAALRLLRMAVPRSPRPRSGRVRLPRGRAAPRPGRIGMAAVRVPRLRWRRRDLP